MNANLAAKLEFRMCFLKEKKRRLSKLQRVQQFDKLEALKQKVLRNYTPLQLENYLRQ